MADPAANILSSDWDGLNPNLIAKFWPVKREIRDDGKTYDWRRIPGSPEVWAPLSEGVIDHTMNWNSPFENIGADHKFSAFSGLMQTGALAPLLAMFNTWLKEKGQGSSLADSAQAGLQSLEGRSSVTKLNSTQVFNGNAPAKITVTAHFRAISDPIAEVHRPYDQLLAWALPEFLAEDGPVLGTLSRGDPSLFPSRIPRCVAMQYAGMLFSPMVIEADQYPLTGPRDKNGRLLSAHVPLSIATLASLDAPAWQQINQNVYSK